jgi:hypothetical protein
LNGRHRKIVARINGEEKDENSELENFVSKRFCFIPVIAAPLNFPTRRQTTIAKDFTTSVSKNCLQMQPAPSLFNPAESHGVQEILQVPFANGFSRPEETLQVRMAAGFCRLPSACNPNNALGVLLTHLQKSVLAPEDWRKTLNRTLEIRTSVTYINHDQTTMRTESSEYSTTVKPASEVSRHFIVGVNAKTGGKTKRHIMQHATIYRDDDGFCPLYVLKRSNGPSSWHVYSMQRYSTGDCIGVYYGDKIWNAEQERRKTPSSYAMRSRKTPSAFAVMVNWPTLTGGYQQIIIYPLTGPYSRVKNTANQYFGLHLSAEAAEYPANFTVLDNLLAIATRPIAVGDELFLATVTQPLYRDMQR